MAVKTAQIRIMRAMPCDLPCVRGLQERNHKDNLPPDKLAQGYLSFRTELPLLGRIEKEIGIVVAKSGSDIAGFEIPNDESHRLEARGGLDPIVPAFQSLFYKGKRLTDCQWVTGQYCVDERFRGMGIPSMMHPEFLGMLRGKFELLVFIIASINARSLHVAIEKFGMVEAIGDAARTWKALVQEIKG